MRGRIPIKPTDIVWTIENRRTQICKTIDNLEHSLDGVNGIVAATDVHEFGKEIVKSVLTEAGMNIFDLGANVGPQEIIDTIIETDSKFVLVSTFNGIALTYASELLNGIAQQHLDGVTVIMGGLLNENVAGQTLPVNVDDKLTEMGVVCSSNADQLVDLIKQRL